MKKAQSLFWGLLVFIACLSLQPHNSIGRTTVRLATLEWEPYIGEQLQGRGYVAQLVRLAFASSEFDVELSFFPWARTVQMALEGGYDGYIPEYYSEEVAKKFIFSDPFPAGELLFFKRKDNNISFTTLRDLQPYTIGVVRGYVNSAEFDKATYLIKEEAVDDLQNMRKLLESRIDLMVADKYVGLHLLKTYLPERMEEVIFLKPPLDKKQLHLCISRNNPHAQAILNSFNAGLKTIRQNGSLLRLVENSLLRY